MYIVQLCTAKLKFNKYNAKAYMFMTESGKNVLTNGSQLS